MAQGDRAMKKMMMSWMPLMLVFLLASGFAPLSSDEAEVRIDGKLVSADGELTFDRDDTVYLEATGIKPNSRIHFEIKKAGIRWMQDDFDVDHTGEVKGIMHIPEQKLTLTCSVEYYSRSGSFHDVKFKLRTR
jgi:hypothetical protein